MTGSLEGYSEVPEAFRTNLVNSYVFEVAGAFGRRGRQPRPHPEGR
jgi:hypothetical protein